MPIQLVRLPEGKTLMNYDHYEHRDTKDQASPSLGALAALPVLAMDELLDWCSSCRVEVLVDRLMARRTGKELAE